jgi:hypothetical protein
MGCGGRGCGIAGEVCETTRHPDMPHCESTALLRFRDLPGFVTNISREHTVVVYDDHVADFQVLAGGALRTRGLLGDYEVTVTHGGWKATRGVKLTRDGRRLTVRLGAKGGAPGRRRGYEASEPTSASTSATARPTTRSAAP